MDRMPVNPSWRSAAGIFLILLLIAAWSVAAVTLAGVIEGAPWPVHLLFYLVAGIGWVLPLKPLLRWMMAADRGRDR
jgi:hypothetical protein